MLSLSLPRTTVCGAIETEMVANATGDVIDFLVDDPVIA